MKKKGSKAVIIGVILAAIVCGIGIFFNKYSTSSTVHILVAPTDATIKINGKDYQNGTYGMFPSGEATIEISKDGFQSKNKKIELKPFSVVTIYDYLKESNGDLSIYKKDLANFEILQLVANDEESLELVHNINFAQTIFDKNLEYSAEPIYQDPHGFIDLSISHTTINNGSSLDKCKQILCLDVYTTDDNLDMAKKLVEDAGYNPNDYQFIQTNKIYK